MAVAATSLVIGLLIGSYFFSVPSNTATILRNQGVLTNSLLGFESNTKGEFKELNPIEDSLRQFLEENSRERRVQAVSVYFRLLNSGRWFVINPEEHYSPASLLKIPIMMAYYKQAEENPEILEKSILNTGKYAELEQESLPDEQKMEAGKSYTIDELIGLMIRDSNNEAKAILEDYLPSDFFEKIYLELKVANPYEVEGDSGDFMSVTDYPFFLRVLYNTTYLNEKYSEKALKLLSESSFTKGLDAKLPPEVLVAHKFGYRIDPEILELHDCGIIYYPDHPYVICVMTKGYDSEALGTTIQDISLLAYKGVEDFFQPN
jgi:beta-lactamase class A